MASVTNEQALEASIEKSLTGTYTEEHSQINPSKPNDRQERYRRDMYRSGKGFWTGYSGDFNPKYAIDGLRFWNFLETTQADELAKLKRQSDWKLRILDRYDRLIRKYGVLRLLKKGLDVDDAHFTLFYQYPLASSSENVKANFERNQFSVTRQVCYSLTNPREEIDMVLFINGIPLITMELKNHWTGQNAKMHGQHQYRFDRDIKQPLLNFARCMVHFAVDTDEIYMTTKLDGANTFFLPFNLGNSHGKGNPPNPNGHKTAYLWEEILSRESLANIIQHFVRLDGKDKDALSTRTLFFPRYHQLDVVRKLITDVEENGVGKTYLIQHSAGSGKSNSITWAAYQLIEAYPINEKVSLGREIDKPIFDSVIVVTDRRLLDKQLRDNISSFSEVKNILAPAYTSKELKKSLEQGKKIIITTIQKFPFIVDGMADMRDKRFAVIIDEAHSGQGGSTADDLNRVIGSNQEEEDPDPQDKILEVMRTRKMRGNASYFAFTATPKNSTLEKFGNKQADGSFIPFHLYSMKQAIEEGFILDVLANYTTYRSYYEIEKSIEDNPLFDTKKAQKKLRSFVENHEQTIALKAEIMFDHFVSKVVRTKKLKGKAKAMVVTQSIESAIRYYFAIRQELDKVGNPFQILIAFSGKKLVDGIERTEDNMNGFPEKDTRDRFDDDAYRILVVANKYLTGFDQPKLTAMYADKKLEGVLAVQALSRLNRSSNKLGKRTEDLFVLDFFNSTDEIKRSFDDFYTSTSLSKETDINVLHDLKASLDDLGVYAQSEVDDFTTKYFKDADAQELSPIIDLAANRFNIELELEDKEKADYKIKAKQFIKIYAQMASLMPYEILAWEKLYWFLKFLIPKLIIPKSEDLIDELLNSVDLSTYGIERIKLNTSIELDDSESVVNPQNSNPRGAHDGEKEEDPLDLIINSFNEKWFQGWEATPEEQRVKFVNLAKNIQAHPDYTSKYLGNTDPQKQDIAFNKIFDDIISKQRKNELDLYRMLSLDDSFKVSMQDALKRILGRGGSYTSL